MGRTPCKKIPLPFIVSFQLYYNTVKSFKEKNSESKVMGGPRRSVSFGDVSERLCSREQDNGLLKETISEQAITSVHNGTFSQFLFQISKKQENFL